MGAAPLTQNCLESKKVCRKLGDVDVDEANFWIAIFVNKWLWWLVPSFWDNKSKQSTNVTVPITKDLIKLIAEAKSHGQLFHATGGSHLNNDNFFKAMEAPVQAKKASNWKMRKRRGCNSKYRGWREGNFGNEQADRPIKCNWAGEVVTWAQCPKKQDGEQKRIESNTKFKSTATTFSMMGSCQWG